MRFDPHIDESLQTSKEQMEILAKQKQEYKYIGTIEKRKGHRLFSYNPETDECKEVKIVVQAALTLDGDTQITNKVEFDPKLWYVQALNKKNAVKKFLKNKKEL